jgi:hypothetical protein
MGLDSWLGLDLALALLLQAKDRLQTEGRHWAAATGESLPEAGLVIAGLVIDRSGHGADVREAALTSTL